MSDIDLNKELNDKLTAAGMFTIEQMMDDDVSGLSPFDTHRGVKTFEDVCEWVDRKRLEYTRMRARDELGPKSELYEWTLAHSAAFTAISKHLRKVKLNTASEIQNRWIPIADIDLPKSRLAPFSMIVSFSNEEKCQSIKYEGDYIDDFITYVMPLEAPPQPSEVG